jgi:4-amino-4-deoxy-L-arabinose transferase-like glycosyltransferase
MTRSPFPAASASSVTTTPLSLSASPTWRALLDPPLLLALLLLVPLVFLLPPVPIDETRYLAVAWEMRHGGEFLVPHLNGATYAHKPPMLFWLINLGWLLTGVHAWTARVMALLCSAASLLLMHRLALRLTRSEVAASHSVWILLGAIYFGAFANAIMFDVLLTTCVLIGVHGICDLTGTRVRRGVALTGGALGLGILVKGPVMLLDIGVVALTAPWWASAALRGRLWRYFGALALALLIGAAIALAWAIPAALHGGPDYAHAIFLRQTLDRIHGVKGASTHSRPWWWYGVVFPLMLLPWPLVLRGKLQAARALIGEPAMRLGLAWLLAMLLVFSMIGGKQPHYLLPAIPPLALVGALLLERGGWRVRSGLFALLLGLVGLGIAWLPFHAEGDRHLAAVAGIAPWWGAVAAGIGVVLFVATRRRPSVVAPALASLALVLVVKLAMAHGTGERYNPQAISAVVRSLQQQGTPLVHMFWHHGVYEFAGRLVEPIPALYDMDSLRRWADDHPDGMVISFYPEYRFRARPAYSEPFRGTEVSIWPVREAIDSGVDKEVVHSSFDVEPAED